MSKITIDPTNKVALVSGSNRGIGKAIAIELLERGAKKVYAGARNINSLNELKEKYGERLVPIKLDVTDEQSIADVANSTEDVQILVNNAGVGNFGGFFSGTAKQTLKDNLAVNVHGLVDLTTALIETLKSQNEAAIVNVSSVAGLGSMPVLGTYSATKAAAHSITQGMRGELKGNNILVTGVYPGPVDTDMAKDFEAEKESPQNVAKKVVDALTDGLEDVYPDPMAEQVGLGYNQSPKAIEEQFAAFA